MVGEFCSLCWAKGKEASQVSLVVNSPPPMQETQEMLVQSLGWENPLEQSMATTPVFLPGESHAQRSLVGYTPQGCKQSDMAEVT